MSAARHHPSFETLLEHWLREGDPAGSDAVDAHLLGCDRCGETLDRLIALGDGVKAAFAAGAVAAVASDAFVRRLADRGLRVREYRVPLDGSVNCTVAPDDELLAAHLEAPLQGVEHRLQDIPFDPGSGEVLYLSRIADVKRMPAHVFRITLLAVADGETRELGRYTFNHRPWPAA